MPQTYCKPVDPNYIPPARPGYVWMGNSDRPMMELAIAEYTGYDLSRRDIVAIPWEPGGKIRWALYLRVK